MRAGKIVTQPIRSDNVNPYEDKKQYVRCPVCKNLIPQTGTRVIPSHPWGNGNFLPCDGSALSINTAKEVARLILQGKYEEVENIIDVKSTD